MRTEDDDIPSLPRDSQGFLVGTVIQDLRRREKGLDGALDDIRAIRVSVEDIRDALAAANAGQLPSIATQAVADSRPLEIPEPRLREDGRGVERTFLPEAPAPAPLAPSRQLAAEPPPSATVPAPESGPAPIVSELSQSGIGAERLALQEANVPAPQAQDHQPEVVPLPSTAAALGDKEIVISVPRLRDERGRFAAKKAESPAASRKDGAGQGAQDVGGILRRFTETVGRAMDNGETIDPAIQAFHEISQPIVRGYDVVFGKSEAKKKESWYRKIFGELRLFRREESAESKANRKVLREIADKPPATVNEGGGLFGGLFGGALGGIGKLLGGAATLAKGLGKRLPFVGALVAGAGALTSIFGEDDPEKSDAENRAARYSGVGGAGGMLAGGLVGAKAGAAVGALAGPVGAAVGGFLGGAGGMLLGDKFGQKAGEWTASLVDSDLPGKMLEKWSDTLGDFKSAWDSVMDAGKSLWGGLTSRIRGGLANFGNGANSAIQKATGVDVKASVGKGADFVSEKASTAQRFVAENAPKLVPDTVKRVASAVSERFSGDKDDFVKRLYPEALKTSKELGVPVEAVIGQAALESSYGKKQAGENNFFGMKAGKNYRGATADVATHEVENGQTVAITDRFRSFGSVAEGMQGHRDFLTGNRGRYSQALNTSTPEQYFAGLKSGGYATDPDYVNKGARTAASIRKRIDALGLTPDSTAVAAGEPTGGFVTPSLAAAVAHTPLSTPPPPVPRITPPPAPPVAIAATPVVQVPASAAGQDNQNITVSLPPNEVGPVPSDQYIAHVVSGGIVSSFF